MNYKKLYYKLCNYCKNTSIEERMKSRDNNDERLSSDYIYTECHHIIPNHSNGDDSHSNLVEMLPEEHFMAHLIRYKAYNDRNDFLSIRFMINGYNGKSMLESKLPNKLKNKMVRMFKSNMSEFRNSHGWHTLDGKKRISEARRGTIVVKTSNGNIISVDVNHPKVVSGEWKHHTYGMLSVFDNYGNKLRITSEDYQNNKELYTPNTGNSVGENNSRYSGFTDDDIVNYMIKVSNMINVGYIIPYPTVRKFCEKFYNIKLPKHFSDFRFNGNKVEGLMKEVSSKSPLKFDKYLFNKRNLKNKINNKIEEILNVKN